MLRPFSRFCITIGVIPESIIKSLSYEEQLLRLIKFLRETVIPAIDGNTEAIKAIEEWIDTVDLEEYVDNKLDEMAEDGTLAEIIEDYATIPELTNRVSTLENEVEEINQKEKYIIMGDSYGAMSNDTWIDKLITLLGNTVDCQKIALGGMGFSHISSLGYSFLTYLQHVESDVTDKNRVTKIIVGGGYNDYNENYSDIMSAITSFINYCKDTYPNAKVYIACIGFNKALTTEGVNVRSALESVVVPAYSASYLNSNTPIYIANSENILKNDALIGDDNVHPTSSGQEYIAKKLYNYIRTNSLIINNKPKKQVALSYNNVGYTLLYKINDYNTSISTNGTLTITSFPENTSFVSGGPLSTDIANYIGDINFTDFYPRGKTGDNYVTKNFTCAINCTEGNFRSVPCTLWIRYDRKLYIVFHTVNSNGYQTYSNISYLSLNEPLTFEIPN